MKKTLFLLLAFLMLGAAAVWYLSNGADKKTSRLAAERTFAVPDTAQIYKIFIADRHGVKTLLERKNGYWQYNGKYRARENAMENLLDAIRRVEMKFMPTQAMAENIIKNLASDGIKVEIYGQKDKLLMAYYIGGATTDEQGTFILREDFDQPYVAHLPGWVGNLRFRYNLAGDEWRDRAVFSTPLENIQALSVEYPLQRDKSFRIERKDGEFVLYPFYEITPMIGKPLRKGAIESYLTGFSYVSAETFQNRNPAKDSLDKMVPFCQIMLTDTKGDTRSARFYPRDPQIVQNPVTGQNEQSVERFNCLSSTGDFMVVQNVLLKKVLWAYDYFYE